MFDAASDIRIEWSVVENCLEPLMASTMLDVPAALDVVKLTLAISTGLCAPPPFVQEVKIDVLN